MITFLLGLTVGVLLSIGVGLHYANKLEKENKVKQQETKQDLESLLKGMFEVDGEESATVLTLVKKDEDEDPEPTKH